MILVEEYDPAWPGRFEALREEYAEALAAAEVPVVAIEHVGSTSVPGLAAKPVIDIDVVVGPDHVAAASAVMESLGFVARGDLGVPERYAFRAPERLGPTHTYVVVEGSLSLRNHLGVRRVLREHAALREEYAETKRRAGREAADIDEYIAHKSDVVQRILAAAGVEQAERAAIDAVNRPTGPPRG
ncbi:GrpB family protein [Nocardioides mangrovicus]|uniref:GrpB family protein n=1 Tax=Nocardioides mangrovicus TaxID=2478913 RepID=A0A3L8P7G0_9ACTN|nr:GrpB family protein [Nocardioides mangrovicus]RLV50579.1 GrpB family protein [Nocardioides mangrovicus]